MNSQDPSPAVPESAVVASVDHDRCMGVSMCMSAAASAFRLNDDGQAEFLGPGKATPKELEEAAHACPMAAITLHRK